MGTSVAMIERVRDRARRLGPDIARRLSAFEADRVVEAEHAEEV